ncbi:MAG: hypothetical protein JRH11_09055 [Deltaproteobacteria bacterium]|nr:hypothetical protein [Deltaproteobacteria bacterium]
MNATLLFLGGFALGCGGSPATATEAAPPSPSTTPSVNAYDLHEWGLVSIGPNGFELAAGPGDVVDYRVDHIAVEKPVLYVHAQQAMALRVTVTPGPGLEVAEHWPLVDGELSWAVQVEPGECPEPRSYPAECDPPDHYCETAELARYETADAACLAHEDQRLPLLFYRLRADEAPEMPLEVSLRGEDVVVHNRAWHDGIGAIWRVRWRAETNVTNATRVPVPAIGETVTIPSPGGAGEGVEAARRALRADVSAHGLTAPETDVFMRAWDEALFGGPVSEEDQPDDDRAYGPRVADAILYWLPANAIEGLATVQAVPTPRHLRRAMLARVAVR